jgi:hypothetical protein
MIAYKVVYVGGRWLPENAILLWSSLINNTQAVVYTPNQWVEPRKSDSRLFVFSRVEVAKDFISKGYSKGTKKFDFEVWECEIKNPLEFTALSGNVQEKHLEEFWSNVETYRTKTPIIPLDRNQETFHLIPAPEATWGVTAVKLTKKIL